jgi:hypothetical protein
MYDSIMWQQGRQGAEYFKWTLLRLWHRADLHILKIMPHAWVPIHRDPVEAGRRHWRINITILGGGSLLIRRNRWLSASRRVVAFEPGALDHAFRNAQRATYQVSIGWTIRG